MKNAQKIIKYLAIAFGLYLAINIIGWIIVGVTTFIGINLFTTSQETINYSQTYEKIENLDLDINAAEFNIMTGEEFKIEASNINEKCKIKLSENTLKIEDYKGSWNINNSKDAKITLYIPEETILNKVKIDFGAGETKIDNLNAQNIDLNLGAGKVTINNISSTKTNIDCGAGEVSIKNADVSNMKLNAGVGKISFNGYIRGNSEIECGIGELNLDLKGTIEDYEIETEHGIGEITINGDNIKNDTTTGSGENKIKIEGGIGAIKINIEE